ncbi:MAG: FecCD family ABC transporter permease [Anaerolineales bacterium]|jgi:iron complex transport system permease protein
MHKPGLAYGLSTAFLGGALVLSVALGAVAISPGLTVRILANALPGVSLAETWPTTFQTILLQVRLPHALLIGLTGAALASSGAAYQGLFRNPLADPYLIGVASGAGLGAVITMAVHWPETLAGYTLIPLGAFVGALATVFLVYWLARVDQIVPLTMLILAGVAVSAFASAITSFLMLRSDDQLYRALAFLLGGSPVSGWQPVLAILPYLAVGMAALVLSGHSLNVLQFGEEQASQLGLPVERAKIIIIVIASLTTAGAVAFSGVIGFIGLIVPHTLRILVGSNYRHLIPLSVLSGAGALLVADLLARFILAPQIIPVGIVTALAGAPFFLWILRRAKTRVFW